MYSAVIPNFDSNKNTEKNPKKKKGLSFSSFLSTMKKQARG